MDLTAPLLSTGGDQRGLRVLDHGAVDDVGQASFEASQRFFVILPGRAFGLLVGLARGISADLGDGDDVQGVVQLSVAGPGQPMAHQVAGGNFNRCDTGV